MKARIAPLDHPCFRRELVDSNRRGCAKKSEQYRRKTGPVDDSEWPGGRWGRVE